MMTDEGPFLIEPPLQEIPWHQMVFRDGSTQMRCAICVMSRIALGTNDKNNPPAPAVTVHEGNAICMDHLLEAFDTPTSKLIEHAERELVIAGESLEDPMIQKLVDVVYAWADMGHTGGSHEALLPILIKLLNSEALSPITSAKEEWALVDPEQWGSPQPTWQNIRDSRMISHDNGFHYWNVEDKNDGYVKKGYKKLYTSAPPNEGDTDV